jgi:hypothetical protein
MTQDPELPPELRDVEDQLRSVHPAPLREEFQERMRTVPPTRRIRFSLWWTAAAVLLVAATAAWMMARPAGIPERIANRRPGPEGVRPSAGTEVRPTWLAYTRAAAESPEELDRLLTAHDRRLLQHAPALEKNLPL